MTNDFWVRVRATFDAAADAEPASIEAVLDSASGGDEAVRREAVALLALENGNFLDHASFVAAALLPPQIAEGTTIGGYRIVRLIGRGGMGEVYEAVKAGLDYQKRVAIKVLREGAANADAVRRFERERRILAGLEHRNIATLLDGDVLADGRPYLIMEFVEGERITDWCRSRALNIADRLILFRQICGAVSFAHRNLIVHRDLKPGNILVASDGTVKLLDFGIAKVLDGDTPSGDETVTRVDGSALTPQYAAPEQLTGGHVTTATDVYALGLLLFELLTGKRPFARSEHSVTELTRIVLTTDPPMPSTVIESGVTGDMPIARRQLRGDLDAIVLKSLRTNPVERYGTVDEFAADLRRHEQALPVEAMRGHRGYRATKFIGRNRGALLAVTVIAVAIVSGGISTWRESRRTEVQRARAVATNRFLVDMLSSVDPNAAGKEVLMVQVLDSAAARIGRDSTIDPEVEASLRTAIGVSYTSLGKGALAEPHLRRALELRQKQNDDPVMLAQAYHDVARVHDDRGEYAAADSVYLHALQILPLSRDSSTRALRTLLLEQHARMLSLSGNLPEATAVLNQVVEAERDQFGPKSHEVAVSLSQLGVTDLQQGLLEPAETTQRDALAIFRELYKPPHPDIGKTLGRLATALDLAGKRAPADSAYRESLQMQVAMLGADHPDVAWTRANYAGFLLDGKEYDRAIVEADSVLRYRGSSIPETHNMIAMSLQLRGLALAGRGDHPAAEQALRESLALRRKYLTPAHWLIGSGEGVLGEELLRGASRVEGLRLIADGCRIVTQALGEKNPQVRKAKERVARAGEDSATACK